MRRILSIILISTSMFSYGQLKITGYIDAKIGVNYSFFEKIQTEFRMKDGLGSEFNADLNIQYTLVSHEDYNINIGAGITSFPFQSDNKFESIYFPLVIEVIPFKEARNFAFVFEGNIASFKDSETGFQSNLGIRYIFNKHNGKRSK